MTEDFDLTGAVSRQPLEESEIALLRELTQTPGWTFLATKIWPRAAGQLAVQCCMQRTDHDYNQGYYRGFQEARTLVENLLQPRGAASQPSAEAQFHARFRK